MNLYLDVGNTALKWRLYDGVEVSQGDAVHRRDWAAVVRQLGALGSPSRIEVASVAGGEADAHLAELLQDAFAISPRFYYSQPADAGVVNGYAEPSRLGVDRWLAIIETWHRSGASIVVDCGSALTLDAVTAEGRHIGGYIVPGLSMMQRSLVSGTGSIRLSDEEVTADMSPGCSTVDGVLNGILRMSVAFIADSVVALREGVKDTCPVYLTGGDAGKVLPHLPFSAELAPDLVLDGLERVTQGGGRE